MVPGMANSVADTGGPEACIAPACVEIPADPQPWAERRRIPLPLKAGARRVLLLTAAAFFATLGVPFLALGFALTVLGAAEADSIWQWALWAPMGAFIGSGGAVAIGAALTALCDAFRPSPVIEIDERGFKDARSFERPIPWDVVTEVTPRMTRGASVAGVHLRLRHTVAARHNPLRPGTLGFQWRRRPDELYVSLMMLRPGPETLANAIMALVRRHGGTLRPAR
jgi:hypothetical protein